MSDLGLRVSLLTFGIAAGAGCTGDTNLDDGDPGGNADDMRGACRLDTTGTCRSRTGQLAEQQCCDQDVLHADLHFDLSARTAEASISVARSENESIVFQVSDLEIQEVTAGTSPLEFEVTGGELILTAAGKPTNGWAGSAKSVVTVNVAYTLRSHEKFGFIEAPQSDITYTWPDLCGNLFPCTTHPRDGLTFTIDITGVPDGKTAIVPRSVTFPAPSYMAAFAIGEYDYTRLGETSAGTRVGVWSLPGGRQQAVEASEHLVRAFDFLETTIGPYKFGSEVASVSVDWGDGDFGGIEHHPYWHVARGSMGSFRVHHHEAAHGWFGNGVRLACREDFVLSEGVVTYLESRIGEAVGAATGEEIWTRIQQRFEAAIAERDFVIYPDGCDRIASLLDIFTGLTYNKGALFLRQVENLVGRAALDSALSSFYVTRVGSAARMQDLIDHIERETGSYLDDLEHAWLKSTGVPCRLVAGDCED